MIKEVPDGIADTVLTVVALISAYHWSGITGTAALAPVAAATAKDDVRRMSRDEEPTMTAKVPSCTAQSCAATSHIDSERSFSGSVTVVEAPGASWILVKPFSCFGGSPLAAGKPR
jgi:hypothetical protein